MLRIRLRRTGAKKQPRYRLVVADSRAPRDGAFVEVIGWYNPQADPAQVVVNTEKADGWLKRGAQPSDRVAYLLKQAGVGSPPEPVEVAPEPEPAATPRRRASRAARNEAASPAAEPAAAESASPASAEGAASTSEEKPAPASDS